MKTFLLLLATSLSIVSAHGMIWENGRRSGMIEDRRVTPAFFEAYGEASREWKREHVAARGIYVGNPTHGGNLVRVLFVLPPTRANAEMLLTKNPGFFCRKLLKNYPRGFAPVTRQIFGSLVTEVSCGTIWLGPHILIHGDN